jgi:hypothetical protein
MTTAPADERCVARGILQSAQDGRLVLSLPHTDYELHLVPAAPAGDLRDRVGRRVTGVIAGAALRIHPSAGGGRFIEPVIGEPRIIAGVVREIDAAAGSIVIDVGVPIRLRTMEAQDYSVLEVGALANCYVRSGMTFTPIG